MRIYNIVNATLIARTLTAVAITRFKGSGVVHECTHLGSFRIWTSAVYCIGYTLVHLT